MLSRAAFLLLGGDKAREEVKREGAERQSKQARRSLSGRAVRRESIGRQREILLPLHVRANRRRRQRINRAIPRGAPRSCVFSRILSDKTRILIRSRRAHTHLA